MDYSLIEVKPITGAVGADELKNLNKEISDKS